MFNTLENRTTKLIFYVIISLTFTLFNSTNPFFWDSIIQVSVPANWYFDNNFAYFFLPDEDTTSHSTFVGLYLAIIWKIFGKSLIISHFAMLPFVFGILSQLNNLITKANLNKKDSRLVLLAVICDATLVSQMSMITFDVLHIFFFLWCLNSILDKRNIDVAFSFAFLMLTSARASLCGFGIIVYSVIFNYLEYGRFNLRKLFPFTPGLLLFIAFMILVYYEKSWIIANPESPDFKNFVGFVSGIELLRNIGLVGWRLIDFGRVGIWIVFMVILIISLKRKTLFDDYFRNILLIAICQFAIIFPLAIVFRNPFGHRYFLTVIITVSIAVIYWVLKYSRFKYLTYSLIIMILWSGYFWIYPLKIAKGWDATPAHWPYFKVRREMMLKIKESEIPFNEIGTFFPNTGSTEYIDLKDSGIKMPDADLASDKYILYSNIYNVDDIFIDELFNKAKWEPQIEERRNRVFMILFRKIQ